MSEIHAIYLEIKQLLEEINSGQKWQWQAFKLGQLAASCDRLKEATMEQINRMVTEEYLKKQSNQE